MSLRSKVMRGSAYLVMREGLGMVISLGNVLLVTRAIGPAQYGIYTAAYGLTMFLQNFGHLGIGVYLVRQEGEQDPKIYDQAFTLFLMLGSVVTGVTLLVLPWLERWLNISGFASIFQALLLFSLLTLLSQVPLAKLERDLEFKRVAWIELLGQILLFLISLPLAYQGVGAWAPAAGWCVQQIQSLILLCFAAKYVPKFAWNPALIREMLVYGLGVSAASWIWYARALINPLIVGKFAGEAAVGQVALAIRMLDVLSFAKSATYRISIAALAQIQNDTNRLRRVLGEGMELQILTLGPILVIASWAVPIVFPILFGDKWLPAITVFPFLAIGYLSNSMFNLHSSVLYVLRRNWEVAVFHAAYVLLFAGLAFGLVSRFGLIGYGWAESITIVTYSIIHLYVAKNIGSPDYQFAGTLFITFSLALFRYQLGWWVAIGLVIVALLPQTHDKIAHYFKSLRAVKV